MLKKFLVCLLLVPLAIFASAPALAASTEFQTYSFYPFKGSTPQNGVVSFPTNVINAVVVIQSFDADPSNIGGSEVISVAIQNVRVRGTEVSFDVIMETTNNKVPKTVGVGVIALAE